MKYITNKGSAFGLIAMLEEKESRVLPCAHCHTETGHSILREDGNPRIYAVCACGDVSLVTEDELGNRRTVNPAAVEPLHVSREAIAEAVRGVVEGEGEE